MKAWLLVGGYRWRQVEIVLRPEGGRLKARASEGRDVMAVRFHGEPMSPSDLAADLSLEVEGQVRQPLRACQVRACEAPHEWELVAELGS